jgi:hypothetical protein
LIREISLHVDGYTKASKDVFGNLADKLPAALTHAERLSAHNLETGSNNPGTGVHTLVDYLKNLRLK